MKRSKRTTYITISLFFALAMFWDMVTSTLGLLTIFNLFEFDSEKQILQILVDMVIGNSVAFIFAIILAGLMVFADSLFIENFLEPHTDQFSQPKEKIPYDTDTLTNVKAVNSNPKVILYGGLFIWALVKLYDFYSSLIGTAACLIPEITQNYPSPDLSEVLELTTLSQQLCLYLISLVIAASPIIFLSTLRKLFDDD